MGTPGASSVLQNAEQPYTQAINACYQESETYALEITIYNNCMKGNSSQEERASFSVMSSSLYLPNGTVGVPYNGSINFDYSGSLTPTASFSGLPFGITAGTPTAITSDSGSVLNYSVALTGTPTTAGSNNISLILSDTQVSNNYNLTLTINPATTTPSSTTTSAISVPTPSATNSQTVAGIDPAGTNISSNGTVYMITPNGQKRPYTSAGAFLSYGFNNWTNVVPASSADLSLPTGSFIPPRDGKIICSNKGSDTGTCYLITDGQKAAFTSVAVFKALGFSFSNTLSGDVSFLSSAPNISSASQAHLAGTLINKGGTIYLVGDSGLLGVPDIATLTSWGYSLTDSVPANAADYAMIQSGVMTAHTAGALSPFGN